MSIEALVIILVIVLIVCGYFVPGPWRGTPVAGAPGGYNIIGVLLTILIAVIVIVLIFAVLGGGIHLGVR